MFSPSRVAVYLAALAALAGGLAPVVANLDWSSTAGVIAAVVAIAGVVAKWLDGRSKWETTPPGDRRS